jgi:hypothetical protein
MTSGVELPFVDFGRSYLIGNGSSTAGSPEPVEQNDVRLQVESLVRLYDGDTSLTRTIYQCAACKAENTFDATGPGNLFKRPNYDFLPAACGSELLIFRRGLLAGDGGYRRHYPYLPAFGDLRAHIVAAKGVERLIDFRAVAAASSAGTPIIGRTVLADSGTRLRAELEYPIKTINIRYRPDVYQFDTGPVLFPDLSVHREVWADYLSLAFLAYETRTDGHADFVIESPVAVGPDPGAPRVMHYDRHEHRPAINTIWQVTGSGAGPR